MASPPAAAASSVGATGLAPGYVYPPRGPPPPVLPPLPALPTPAPLVPPAGLAPRDMTRLIMLWDFCNVLGEMFRPKL